MPQRLPPPPPPAPDTVVFENPLRERETKVAPGTVMTPVIQALESAAQAAASAAAPVVQFVADIPSFFDPAPAPADDSSKATPEAAARPFAFGPARKFGFVVPDM